MLENCVCTFDSDAGVLVGKLCNAHQRIIDAKVASAISEERSRREAAEDQAGQTHAEVRAGYDKAVTDAWRAEVERVRSYAEELRENLEILHDAMCIGPGGLSHTQGYQYAQSPRCEIVTKLLEEMPPFKCCGAGECKTWEGSCQNPSNYPNGTPQVGGERQRAIKDPEQNESALREPGSNPGGDPTTCVHEIGKMTLQEHQARAVKDLATTGTARVEDVHAILGDPSKGVTNGACMGCAGYLVAHTCQRDSVHQVGRDSQDEANDFGRALALIANLAMPRGTPFQREVHKIAIDALTAAVEARSQSVACNKQGGASE